MRRTLILSMAALITLLPATAEAREDDFDFARGLVEKKFYDLAKEQFEAIVNDTGRPGPQRADGELGLAYLLKAKADDVRRIASSPVDEVVKAFEEAETGFDGFLDKNPRHPKTVDAKFEVGLLLQSKGTYLTSKMEDNASLIPELQPKAEEAFEQSIELFSGAAQGLESRLEDMDEDNPEYGTIEWNKGRAEFYHCVAHYYKGSLFPEGTVERGDILDRAIQLLDDFVWEHETDILGGYAFMYRGLCHKELGQRQDAIEWLSNAFSNMIPDPEDEAEKYVLWTDLYLQAYYKLGEYCNKLGAQQVTDEEGEETTHDYRKDAVKAFDDMRQRIPDCESRLFGLRSMLEQAKALGGLNDFDAALKIATQVSMRSDELLAKEDWAAGTAFLANKLLNELIAKLTAAGEDVTLPPGVLYKAAQGKKSQREWPEAIRAYQQVVKASRSPEHLVEFGIPSWMKIGECYYWRDEYLEAYYLYDHVVGLFRKSHEEAAGEAAYYRYRAATQQFATTRDPVDGELKKRARSAFAKEFPKHPRSVDLQYYEGADTIADADAKASSQDEKVRAEARELYETAVTGFLDKVGSKSILYEKARARKGEVLFKLGKYDDALEVFKWVLTYKPSTEITDSNHKSNRIQSRAIATYYSALCLTKKASWNDALEAMATFEEDFKDPNLQDNFLPAVMYARVQAHLQLKQAQEAENALKGLLSRYPETAQAGNSLQMVGSALHKIAIEAKEKYRQPDGKFDEAYKADVEWRESLKRATAYFTQYLGRRRAPKASEWAMIGFSSFELENWAPAEVALKKADQEFDKEIALLTSRDKVKREEMTKSQETTRFFLSQVLITLKKYADARDYFENLLCRNDKMALKKVRDMLKEADFDTNDLIEFRKLVRADPSLMEGLARIYKELADTDHLRRARTLLNILDHTSSNQYSEKWWDWKLLEFQILLLMGTDRNEDDLPILKKIVNMYDDFESLGLLDRVKIREDLREIRNAAKDEMDRRK